MKLRALLLSAGLVVGLMPFAFGQGSSSPAQPQDPTAQSPAAQNPAANPPATPKTFPDNTNASPSSTQTQPADQAGSQSNPSASSPASQSSATSTDSQNSFTGSIVKSGGKYQLRSNGTSYDLDDQSQAKSFSGKDVKVNGTLDKSSNTIKVQSIEPASPMQ